MNNTIFNEDRIIVVCNFCCLTTSALTHTDVGYTDLQEQVIYNQANNIRRAVELIENGATLVKLLRVPRLTATETVMRATFMATTSLLRAAILPGLMRMTPVTVLT